MESPTRPCSDRHFLPTFDVLIWMFTAKSACGLKYFVRRRYLRVIELSLDIHPVLG